jgi:hypothetical protein
VRKLANYHMTQNLYSRTSNTRHNIEFMGKTQETAGHFVKIFVEAVSIGIAQAGSWYWEKGLSS